MTFEVGQEVTWGLGEITGVVLFGPFMSFEETSYLVSVMGRRVPHAEVFSVDRLRPVPPPVEYEYFYESSDRLNGGFWHGLTMKTEPPKVIESYYRRIKGETAMEWIAGDTD